MHSVQRILKKTLPYAIGLLLAGAFIAGYIFFVPGEISPEKAVIGYTKASMERDVNRMMALGSDYQKVLLGGQKNTDIGKLKEQLKKLYADFPSGYEGKQIAVTITESTALEKESAEYQKVLEDYQHMTGSEKVKKVQKVSIQVSVDGVHERSHTVYAVKIGLRWYYAY